MNMFCKNCGSQIPDNAQICTACGRMVKPVVMPKIPANQPKQPKIHTAPAIHEQIRTAPLIREEIYTAPVEQVQYDPIIMQRENNVSTPTKMDDHVTVPVQQPEQEPEVRKRQEPPKASTKPAQPKKGGSKLPILLILIAAIAALVFFVSKKEPEMEPERIVVVDRNKPRYDSEGFLLSHQEFEALYLSMLEENGISVKKKGVESDSNMGRSHETSHLILQEDRPVRFATSTYDYNGKVWLILLTFRFEEDEIVDLDDDQMKAMMLFYEAIHGPIEKENWESFIEENKVQEETCIVSELKMDGLIFEYRRYDNALMATMEIDEDWWERREEETEPPQTTEAQKPEPVEDTQKFGTAVSPLGEDGLRFDSEAFCFDLDGLKANYAEMLKEIGSPFVVGGNSIYDKNDPHVYFSLKNDVEASVVDVQVVRDIFTNRITKVFASQRWLEEGYEDITTDEIMACLYIIPTCYGPMTEEQWEIIREKIGKISVDDGAFFEIKMNGMSVWFDVEKKNKHFSVGCTIQD